MESFDRSSNFPSKESRDREDRTDFSRRHSNASAISNNMDHFKSKFEVNEPEPKPVFDQGVHGAPEPVLN